MASAIEIVGMIVAAFAGGLFGAALGALPAFIFTGFLVVAGEVSNLALRGVATGAEDIPATLGSTGVTGSIGFGAVFGPHISFAAGAAAAAYAAKKGYMESNWGYHDGKNILMAFGTHQRDVLLVGGLFGILGWAITFVSANVLSAPWDPIAMGVVLSALAHRLAFGYSITGTPHGDGLFDLSPFEREEMIATDGTGGEPEERLAAEPWLGWMYEWESVALIGLGTGILGGYIVYTTGSVFLGFGISAATLIFLNGSLTEDFLDIQVTVPVTHHMTLCSSTAVVAFAGVAPIEVGGEMAMITALLVGGLFGIIAALAGEITERLFYAHADTHWDPPATAIVITTFIIAVLSMVGVFPSSAWVPTPL